MEVFYHSSEGCDHCLHFWIEDLHFSPLRKASLYATPSPHGSHKEPRHLNISDPVQQLSVLHRERWPLEGQRQVKGSLA